MDLLWSESKLDVRVERDSIHLSKGKDAFRREGQVCEAGGRRNWTSSIDFSPMSRKAWDGECRRGKKEGGGRGDEKTEPQIYDLDRL